MADHALSIDPCRPDSRQDANQILIWRNDPITLSMSFHREPKTSEAFWLEYQRDYFVDRALPPFFAVADQARVAFLRFRRIDARSSDISINVAPEQRGRNYGMRSLALACEALAGKIQEVVAEIRVENRASVRTFEKAHFVLRERKQRTIADTGETCEILVYVKNLTA